MLKKRKWMVPLLTVFFLFALVPIAEAHVTVHPSESSTNAYEKYTVRVPVEKDIHTTEVKLEAPDGVSLVSVLPMANWDYKLEKDETGQISSVTWIAKHAGIGPNEFIEFSFIGANPSDPGEVSWKALQTYEDGSVVEWVGPPDSEEPASMTKIVQGDATANHDIDGASNKTTQEKNDEGETASGGTGWLPISLAAVAILLALISLFRKRS